MRGPDSRRLLAYVLLIAVASLLTSDLTQRGLFTPPVAFGVACALWLCNLAVAVGGLRTRQRIAWGAYMILSIAIFFLLGFSNPLSAVILLLPVGFDLMREAWRPL